MSPQRIQRKRTKGWRMPEGAVYVGRPGRFGNPYGAGDRNPNREQNLEIFKDMLRRAPLGDDGRTVVEHIRQHLAGKDLACWCPIEEPCHADVLLKIANPDDVLTTALADPEGQSLVQAILDRKQGSSN